jgi:hypothetical protein
MNSSWLPQRRAEIVDLRKMVERLERMVREMRRT